MHSKFSKRGIHQRRVAGVGVGSEMQKRDFTGPVTLTLTFHDGSDYTPTPIPQPPPTILPPQETASPELTLSPSSPQPSSGIPPPLDPPSPSFFTNASTPSYSTSSAMPAGVTMSNSPTGAISAGNDLQDLQQAPKLSPGAIAGIVIGCLAVLVIAVVLGLRKRTVNNRLKLRGVWARSNSLKVRNEGGRNEGGQSGYETMSNFTTNGQKPKETMGFVGMQGASFGQPPSPRALPSAYGFEGTSGGGQASPKVSVLYETVVARSYVPTLPDELAITTGERLKVLQEFDDGWSECMNSGGDVGMVPLECFGKPGGFGRQTSLGR